MQSRIAEAVLSNTDIPYKQSVFPKPPDSNSYAVWNETNTIIGDDFLNVFVVETDVSIDLYQKKPDDEAISQIEMAFYLMDVEFTEQERIWNEDLKIFQTSFSATVRRKERKQ